MENKKEVKEKKIPKVEEYDDSLGFTQWADDKPLPYSDSLLKQFGIVKSTKRKTVKK